MSVPSDNHPDILLAHLAGVVEFSDDAIFSKTLDGVILTWNRAAEVLYGYTAAEAIGQPVTMLLAAGEPDDTPELMTRLRFGEHIRNYETIRQRKDGARLHVSVTISPIRDDSGAIMAASAIARDITQHKRAEGAVRSLNAFLGRLADQFASVLHLPDLLDHVLSSLRDEIGFDSCSIALTDELNPDTLVIKAASGLRQPYLGLRVPADQGLHGVVMRSAGPLYVPDMDADPRELLPEPSVKSAIYAPLVANRRVIGVLSAFRPKRQAFGDADLNVLSVVARYLTGAFEVARLYEQVKTAAATDPLTGLANRRSFLDRMEAELARCRRSGEAMSVALLDLNRLKVINDRYGHSAGDHALVTIAAALRKNIRASDTAARIGGDEFALLFPGTARQRADQVVRRIVVPAMTLPEVIRRAANVTFSWGTAAYPRDGESTDLLLQAADRRLYRTKRKQAPGTAPSTRHRESIA